MPKYTIHVQDGDMPKYTIHVQGGDMPKYTIHVHDPSCMPKYTIHVQGGDITPAAFLVSNIIRASVTPTDGREMCLHVPLHTKRAWCTRCTQDGGKSTAASCSLHVPRANHTHLGEEEEGAGPA
eukprot:1160202-Pelagomonas_calceolata.AAC.4